jgi:hypothetical protein
VVQVAPRYREARGVLKSRILDEFVASTGYARKYAIRLLRQPMVAPARPLVRPRARQYGPAVEEALLTAWRAANGICAKRLVPFLPDLVASLERHGHLTLSDEVRAQLLCLSPATADRLLRVHRARDGHRGIGTTTAGTLLKHQVVVRTFADWDDVTPGFMEADLVAHCGPRAEGSYLYTLVLTDVATGWTECLALPYRTQEAVVQALERVRRLLPFPLLGLDTDNGGEFLNAELMAYCAREEITFTRGRAYKKNDQCYVEQKNGSIVRQLVGYDRYEGERAYRQLAELYRAVRLYVNGFQPSMKLRAKHREGSRVRRTYDDARTPLQRLLATDAIGAEAGARLTTLFQMLDPVRLLHQVETLRDALWRHAIHAPAELAERTTGPTARFNVTACGAEPAGAEVAEALARLTATTRGPRRYRRTKKTHGPRTYRTRPDPFATVWPEVEQWLATAPERTALSLFQDLQQRYPDQYADGQVRTFQRRVKAWRAQAILVFDAQWVDEDLRHRTCGPSTLRAVAEAEDAVGVAS